MTCAPANPAYELLLSKSAAEQAAMLGKAVGNAERRRFPNPGRATKKWAGALDLLDPRCSVCGPRLRSDQRHRRCASIRLPSFWLMLVEAERSRSPQPRGCEPRSAATETMARTGQTDRDGGWPSFFIDQARCGCVIVLRYKGFSRSSSATPAPDSSIVDSVIRRRPRAIRRFASIAPRRLRTLRRRVPSGGAFDWAPIRFVLR
jgi:hypothetical protein